MKKHRKQILSLVLAFCLLLTLTPFPAAAVGEENVAEIGNIGYASLQEAIEAVGDGDTIKLLDNVAILGTVTLDADIAITLDLNGKTVTSSITTTFLLKKGVLHVVDTAETKGGIRVDGEAFRVNGQDNENPTNTILNIGAGVNVTSATDCSVYIIGKATLNTAGNLTSMGKFCTIQGNGNADNGGTVISITGGSVISDYTDSENANIYSRAAGAIYVPQANAVTISGGTITGGTALYVKSGLLTISGGTFTGTGASAPYAYYGNGFNGMGQAITVDNCGYPGGAPVVSITGGTFNSINATAVGSYSYGDENTPITRFITGGTFSDFSCMDYLGSDANVNIRLIDNAELTEHIRVTNGATLNLDLNGKTVSKNSTPFIVSGGKLHVTGEGAIRESANDQYAAIMIFGSPDSNAEKGYSTVTIDEQVHLSGWSGLFINRTNAESAANGWGVQNTQNHAHGVLIEFNGKIETPGEGHTAAGHGIYINGQIQDRENAPVIHIKPNAVIDGRLGNGIYAAGYATWNVEGTITGKNSGIALKAGTLNISGGTIQATGENGAPTEGYSNGVNASGAAIQVESNDGYAGGIIVQITGGTIESKNGYALYEYLDSGNATTEVSHILISGGNLNGELGAFLISSELANALPRLISVTGGTFSSDPSAYVASGYVVSGSNPWTVQRYVAPPSPPVTPPAVTVPVSDGENKVDVTAQIEDETAVLDVNLDNLGKVVSDESPAGPLVIDLSALKQPISTVVLPADALQAIASAAKDEDSPTSGLTVQTAAGAVQLDALTLQALADAGNGALSLTISPVPANDLTAEQTDLIGDGLVIRLEAHVGGAQVSSFGGGLVTVSIPVVGEPKTGMIVWRVSEKADGSPLLMPIACTYNAKTNCYEFQTPQFSYYALGQFPFTDVPGGAWFYENVVYAYQNGLMEGIGNDLFAPGTTTTRAMLITMLWRLENKPDAPKPDFTDLEKDWYRAAVAWAADAEISIGYGDGRFGPEDVLTREQLVTILYRYAQYKGLDVSKENDLSGFTDKALVADWAEAAMRWAVEAGLVQGNDGKLMPQNGAERAQTAALLQRYLAQ